MRSHSFADRLMSIIYDNVIIIIAIAMRRRLLSYESAVMRFTCVGSGHIHIEMIDTHFGLINSSAVNEAMQSQ